MEVWILIGMVGLVIVLQLVALGAILDDRIDELYLKDQE